jgi:alpha-glucosidase
LEFGYSTILQRAAFASSLFANTMKLKNTLMAGAGIFWLLTSSPAISTELKSPDGRLKLEFELRDFEGREQCPIYSVTWNGRTVIALSRLNLELKDTAALDKLKITGEMTTAQDSTWRPVCGERSEVRDHYNQLVVNLEQQATPHHKMTITFRAYDSGAAFCYTIPKQSSMESVEIKKEDSEFRFVADHAAWAVYTAQGVYQKISLSKIKSGCERPLPIEVSSDTYTALAEARLVNYARTKFGPLKGQPHGLVTELASPVTATAPLTTPWRVIMVANSPGQLLENNDLILNLNDPNTVANTSWIKPGKVIREVTLTTDGGKACVDFAAKRNLQYILFDAGWYGHEFSKEADASEINVDPKRSKGPLDLHEVIRYGNERGIGTILYVNQNALSKQLDDILPLYRKWGVKGVKYGFVNVGSQKDTMWLHEAIRKAATNHLMIDIHDEYRPTGYQRTYPNLMTMEGIAGDETSPPNSNTLTLLFSRLLAGPADNTICYFDGRVTKNASHAYQLAKSVCLFSPWQHLYWYDRPPASPARAGGAGGSHPTIGNEPELQFFDALPTTWDETKVLHGRIGEYAVIARRHDQDWFIGAMNSGEPRTLRLPLNFLTAGKKYNAHIYSDDSAASSYTKVKITETPVNASTVLEITLSPQGGQAMRLTPQP